MPTAWALLLALTLPPAAGEALSEAINGDRLSLDRPLLELHPAVERAAQQLADTLARGGVHGGALSVEALREELLDEGYGARRLVLGVVQTGDPPREVATVWALEDLESYQGFLEVELEHLGVGVAAAGGPPIYVALATLSEAGAHERSTRGLADLEAVRRELLGGVNREREAQGLAPLRSDHRLQATAQRYAERMLEEGFYGHLDPQGSTVLERAKAEGYPVSRVGENLASGHEAVAQVLAGWMASPPHRENILSPAYTEVGSGLAYGPGEDGYKVLWVQVFGRPR